MIKQIHIKNYILIDELVVKFDKGLNVITGETGAGKSIVIQAIDIIFAPRVSKEIIKTNCEKASIELILDSSGKNLKKVFERFGLDLPEDFRNEIIISKEISQNGSRTRVNGTLVNLDFIKILKEKFIDIHSQHQTYEFLQSKYHINLLDSYSKDKNGQNLNEYKTLYTEYESVLAELDIAKSSSEVTESQIDFLKFQIQEIEEAQIEDAQEYENLRAELSILENSEKLKELTGSAHWALNQDDNSIITALGEIKSNISKASLMDETLLEAEEKLIDAVEILSDTSSELRNYFENLNNDTQRLNDIQERIFLLDKLQRKYGGEFNSLEGVLKTHQKLTLELSSIEHSTKNIEELEGKIKETLIELNKKADIISAQRQKLAMVLSSLIVEKLEKLELARTQFSIAVEPCELNAAGKDRVEFLISTNVSEDLKPLIKVASGGEVSRVMLALKAIFAQNDEIDTVIFDEIDTGISGRTSQSVADEIAELSTVHQIILITHQPIIASKAHKHFYVKKVQNEHATQVGFYVLKGENRIKALAELAGGEINDKSIDFARALLS